MRSPSPPPRRAARRPRAANPRGDGPLLRDEIVAATIRLLEELGEDEALSLRAVAREVGVAATSVYLHFADRDALLAAVMEACYERLMQAAEQAELAGRDPVEQLRARVLAYASWAQDHVGLYKLLHESTLHMRKDLPFMRQSGERVAAAVRRCMDAELAPPGDPVIIAMDLRTAVHGMLSSRFNQPHIAWPPLTEQLDRFLTKLVGTPSPGKRSRRS